MGEDLTATLSRHDVPRLGGFEGDTQTRRWVARGWRPEDSDASRSLLLTHAQVRIAQLTSAGAPGRDRGWLPVPTSVSTTVMALLDFLIKTDDLATPQIAPTPEGGLNVEWLVSGDSLSLTVDREGVSLIAEFDNGEFAFPPLSWDFQHDSSETLGRALASASLFLEKISTGIQHRLLTR